MQDSEIPRGIAQHFRPLTPAQRDAASLKADQDAVFTDPRSYEEKRRMASTKLVSPIQCCMNNNFYY